MTAAADADDPAAVGRALFELSFGLRWQGRYREAREVLDALYDDLDALSGSIWMAWSRFEHGCLLGVEGRPDDAIHVLLEAAERCAEFGYPIGEVGGLLAAWSAHRAAGRSTGAVKHRLRKLSREVTLPRFTTEAIRLELAEEARAHGDLTTASRHCDAVLRGGNPIHQALALLALGEVSRARGEDVAPARAAQALGESLRCRGIVAHALITRALAHDVPAADAEGYAREIDLPPVRPAARGVAAYCFGRSPAEHVLYFP